MVLFIYLLLYLCTCTGHELKLGHELKIQHEEKLGH